MPTLFEFEEIDLTVYNVKDKCFTCLNFFFSTIIVDS